MEANNFSIIELKMTLRILRKHSENYKEHSEKYNSIKKNIEK